MDNLRSHHVKGVKEAFTGTGVSFLYLPPHSPDLNPIEKMWSKMKGILRAGKVRDKSLLPQAIMDALALVAQKDCQGWFSACGYCQ